MTNTTIFFSARIHRSRTLIEAAPEKNQIDFAIEAAAYKRHNTVYRDGFIRDAIMSTESTSEK